jgi:hypothetical protein
MSVAVARSWQILCHVFSARNLPLGLTLCLYHFQCLVIDAAGKGNKTKFANHSSTAPNMFAQIKLVQGEHRIGMYSKRRLYPGEEIFFDYKHEHEAMSNPDAHAPSWFQRIEGKEEEGETTRKKGVALKHTGGTSSKGAAAGSKRHREQSSGGGAKRQRSGGRGSVAAAPAAASSSNHTRKRTNRVVAASSLDEED